MSADHPEILKLPTPIRCKILERVNKFKVKIEFDGRIEYALCNWCVSDKFIYLFGYFGICGANGEKGEDVEEW